MEANEQVKNAVFKLLEKYSQGYQDKDIEGMLKLFVPEDDLVVIGTGFDEWIKGSEELRCGFERDLEQATRIRIKYRDVTISASGQVAWLSCHMNMEAHVNGQEIYLPGRLSAVVEEKNNEWLFAHLHYSLPAMDQEEGKAYPEP